MTGRFHPGEAVTVRLAFPPGHVRTPYYCRGRTGVVDSVAGSFANPEALAYGRAGERVPLYRVRFRQADLWPAYEGPADDHLVIDIFEHWLEPSPAPIRQAPRATARGCADDPTPSRAAPPKGAAP